MIHMCPAKTVIINTLQFVPSSPGPGVYFVHTPIWLQSHPAHTRALHWGADITSVGGAAPAHRAATAGPVWQLCDPACVR